MLAMQWDNRRGADKLAVARLCSERKLQRRSLQAV